MPSHSSSGLPGARSPRADRAVLEWPGRPLRHEDAVEAVRTAISAAGTPGDFEIDIPDFSPPLVPFEAITVPTVSQLDYDGNTGRFTAMLSITGEGMNPINTRIERSGRGDGGGTGGGDPATPRKRPACR